MHPTRADRTAPLAAISTSGTRVTSWRLKKTRPVFARIRLRWLSTIGRGERLEIASITALPGQPLLIDPADVRLKLNTMLDESFWLDEPRFDADGIFTA